MHTAALLYFIVCCSALAAYMAGFLTAAWWLGAERQEPHPDPVQSAATKREGFYGEYTAEEWEIWDKMLKEADPFL